MSFNIKGRNIRLDLGKIILLGFQRLWLRKVFMEE